jgi:hypothetical protein
MFTALLPSKRSLLLSGADYMENTLPYCWPCVCVLNCLQRCCLVTRWSNLLQYKSSNVYRRNTQVLCNSPNFRNLYSKLRSVKIQSAHDDFPMLTTLPSLFRAHVASAGSGIGACLHSGCLKMAVPSGSTIPSCQTLRVCRNIKPYVIRFASVFNQSFQILSNTV